MLWPCASLAGADLRGRTTIRVGGPVAWLLEPATVYLDPLPREGSTSALSQRIPPAVVDDAGARATLPEGAAGFPYRLSREERRADRVEPAGCNIVTSRAFASLEDFAMLAGRHVDNGGTLVAMKGKVPDDEIQALHARGEWQVDHIQPLRVPELQAERCLIWMRRSQGTL